MADIVLNVEVRDRTGTGGAREARRQQKVPGVLYGGPKGPVAIAVRQNEFRKALYTGKLLGHLVTLRHGKEDQPVIAKDIQFHPVTDEPIHFDLYRVEEGQEIHINVPVHFRNEEASPGMKQGGSLEIVRHDLELVCRADRIPEELVVDLTGRELGDTIRLSDITLPAGVRTATNDPEFVIASIKVSSAAQAEDAEAAAAASEGAAPEAQEEAASTEE
ncbi:MAG TPA: 50S ribosomal protein L25/general stress protein Ctc [Caulobacteraceae bacterium]|nr:50S ribosomal protein L25/general stress protein Ctc [Caulobacteraceae bacterium]